MKYNFFGYKLTVFVLMAGLLTGLSVKAQDWPNLKRYQTANEQVKDSTINVVYMGDSITDFWLKSSPDFFSGHHYAGRGISGQVSPQMLIRFRQDVINLKPKAVVLLCGTNDIAGNKGPSTLEMIADNISSMCELAKANHIKVVLCSVLPANKFPWKPDLEPAEPIIKLNAWIKAYAQEHRFAYVDYYQAMVNEEKGMKAGYTEDGVHPNKAGYTVMEGIIQPVLEKLL
ncbi:SGNH/GDSL hydrolase family protein [Mucilaginibacter boryungensis]|uniref:SGNH/GDSL hydrolase family protein n=1 Tax=Mucilaginibacter boryungensis TaxID=768480 RepID=A0ABR9XIC7_9SPHI|nr:SGNH/GDSL hydrolase family protein [Mucilaginibacter boryungensis]MBE9666763.1 SGNH/GDSL hydrolase family protein [Mucilaginibacter boryungensis]